MKHILASLIFLLGVSANLFAHDLEHQNVETHTSSSHSSHSSSSSTKQMTEKSCKTYSIPALSAFVKKKDLKCAKSAAVAINKGQIELVSGFGHCSHSGLHDDHSLIRFELQGSQTVPTSTSLASGLCTAIVSNPPTLIQIICSHTVVNPTLAHLHLGAAGTRGPLLCSAKTAQSPFAIVCPLDLSSADSLGAGELYINLHSVEFPDGELRGQVR